MTPKARVNGDVTQGITGILNVTAGKPTTRSSPRKRTAAEVERKGYYMKQPESPGKRQKVHATSMAQAPPNLGTSRLKRKSESTAILQPHNARNRNVYDPPEDAEELEQIPARKMRQMVRKPQNQLSRSFAGAKIHENLPESILDLDNSPAGRTRSKAKRATSMIEDTADNDATNAVPRSPDRLRKQGRSDEADETQHFRTARERADTVQEKEQVTPIRKQKPQKGTTKEQPKPPDDELEDPTYEQDEEDLDPREEYEDSLDGNEPVNEEGPEREAGNVEAAERPINRRTSRPKREGQRGQSLAVHPEPNQTRKVLEDFEEQAAFGNCRTSWAKMLVGAKFNMQTETRNEIRTTAAKSFFSLVGSTKALYKSLEEADEDEIDRIEGDIIATTDELEQQFQGLAQLYSRVVNQRLIMDIYLHVIPSLVYLLKAVVKARYQDGKIDSVSLGEIIYMLELTHNLCERARQWQPRPSTLDSGVLGDTRSAIALSVTLIMDTYQITKYKLDQPAETEKYHERRWTRQAEIDKKIEREKEQRRVAIAEEKRKRWERQLQRDQEESDRQQRIRSQSYAPQNGTNRYVNGHRESEQPRPAQPIWDIDDDFHFDTGDVEINGSPMRPKPNANLSTVAWGKLPERPRPTREQTADLLPPPIQSSTPWTDDEVACLVTSLQQFTGPNRFEQILDRYGALGGWLAKRDIDELMAQAKFVRASWAVETSKMGGGWDGMEWLRSVPR